MKESVCAWCGEPLSVAVCMRSAAMADASSPSAPSLTSHAASSSLAAFATESIPPQDIERLTEMQAELHDILHSTNEDLAVFNQYSAAQHAHLAARFGTHVATLQDVHASLLNIFRRVRSLRTSLIEQHPELAKAAAEVDASREAEIETSRGAISHHGAPGLESGM